MSNEPEKQVDGDIDTWLQNVLAEAAARFPEAGLFFLAVTATPGGEADLSVAANMPRKEVDGVLTQYVGMKKHVTVIERERTH